MDFREIELFLHLSRTLHFGKTSQACHLSASALSRSIQRVERELGHELFERDQRSVRLTERGELFREFASNVTADFERLKERLRPEQKRLSGTISVFATVTACQSFLPALLNRFREAFPDIHVRLETGYASEAFDMLEDGKVDVAVAALPERTSKALVTRIVTYTPLSFVAPLLACDVSRRVEQRPIDWRTIPVVLPATGLARAAVQRWFKRQRVEPNVYSQVSGNEAILSLVSTGCAVGVVPRLVLDQSPLRANLRVVETERPIGEFRVGLCTFRRRLSDPLVNAFWSATG